MQFIAHAHVFRPVYWDTCCYAIGRAATLPGAIDQARAWMVAFATHVSRGLVDLRGAEIVDQATGTSHPLPPHPALTGPPRAGTDDRDLSGTLTRTGKECQVVLYNVAQQVVAIVDAADEASARAELAARLRRAGFEPDGDGDAFVSDDQTDSPDLDPTCRPRPVCDLH